MTARSHHDNAGRQFGSQANAYSTSTVHASGYDLLRLGERLSAFPQACVLDTGCGAGHANFVTVQHIKQVVAYNLSSQMPGVIAEAAKDRGLENITTRQGYAESLPFEDSEFDVVISRYSVHHQHNVGRALQETDRVLKPGGVLIVVDAMSSSHPVHDIWLQAVKALHDISHVRSYSSRKWLSLINDANLIADTLLTDHLPLEFSSWVARMRTPAALSDAIRTYQQSASADMKVYFALQEDGSFTSDTIVVEVHKVG